MRVNVPNAATSGSTRDGNPNGASANITTPKGFVRPRASDPAADHHLRSIRKQVDHSRKAERITFACPLRMASPQAARANKEDQKKIFAACCRFNSLASLH